MGNTVRGKEKFKVYLCRKRFHPREGLSKKNAWIEAVPKTKRKNGNVTTIFTERSEDFQEGYIRIHAGDVFRPAEEIKDLFRIPDLLLILKSLGLPYRYEIRVCRKKIEELESRMENPRKKDYHLWLELMSTRNPKDVRMIHFTSNPNSPFEEKKYHRYLWKSGSVVNIVGYTNRRMGRINTKGRQVAKEVFSGFNYCFGIGKYVTNCQTFAEKMLKYLNKNIDSEDAFKKLNAHSGTSQGKDELMKLALASSANLFVGLTVGTLVAAGGSLLVIHLIANPITGIPVGLCVGAGIIFTAYCGGCIGGFVTVYKVVKEVYKDHKIPDND